MATRRELQQFVEVVKEALQMRLAGVNLDLLDIGLKEHTPDIIVPGVDQYYLVGWVRKDLSGKVVSFVTRIGVEVHDTKPEDVDPLVKSLAEKLIEDFYPTRRDATCH